jgi:hypothetical protein
MDGSEHYTPGQEKCFCCRGERHPYEKLLRSFVRLSEESGGEVSTTLPHGERWVRISLEVMDEKPDLAIDDELVLDEVEIQ